MPTRDIYSLGSTYVAATRNTLTAWYYSIAERWWKVDEFETAKKWKTEWRNGRKEGKKSASLSLFLSLSLPLPLKVEGVRGGVKR